MRSSRARRRLRKKKRSDRRRRKREERWKLEPKRTGMFDDVIAALQRRVDERS